MSVAIALTAFLLIFPIELPDKTFVATLVLATRYRPLPVWLGVIAAFAVQTVVAVTLGGLIGRLPRTYECLLGRLLGERRPRPRRSSKRRRNPVSTAGGSWGPASSCCSLPSGVTCRSC